MNEAAALPSPAVVLSARLDQYYDPADLRVGNTGEITHPRYWESAYRAAAAADLDWRRARNTPPGTPTASPPDVGDG